MPPPARSDRALARTAPTAPSSTAETAAVAPDAAARVLRQFRQVFNSVKTHFQQVERKVGIGGAQLWALGVIRDHPGIGVTELARRLDIHQTTASNLVRALVDAELVTTARDEADRRSVHLHTLPAAARLLRRAPGPLTGVLPEALARLDARTLVRLEADLAALLAVLQADAGTAGIPLGATTADKVRRPRRGSQGDAG